MYNKDIILASRKLVEKIIELYRQELPEGSCRFARKIEAYNCPSINFLSEYAAETHNLLEAYSTEVCILDSMYMKGV